MHLAGFVCMYGGGGRSESQRKMQHKERTMTNPRTQRILIGVLGVVTALVHLWLFYSGMSRGRPNYLFLANGIGYLALLGAFFATRSAKDQIQNLVGYLLMAYAAVTIVAWVVLNGGRFLLGLSIVTKLAEVLLIVMVWMYMRATQRRSQTIPA
jgi:hypothetical protein